MGHLFLWRVIRSNNTEYYNTYNMDRSFCTGKHMLKKTYVELIREIVWG